MLFPHGRVLVCRPNFFDVTYEINPWMSVQRTPQIERAKAQWQMLHHTLLRLGAWLEYVEPAEGLPDMVFTANAGLVRGNRVILSHFRYAERQGEEPLFEKWFAAAGYEVIKLTGGFFEGQGDALFAGERLFCGCGFRSDADVFPEVGKLLELAEVVVCELVDPRFYHLDTCFCPLDANRALYVPTAFKAESIKCMQDKIELFPVEAADAARFACNAVVLGKDVILPAGCAGVEKVLKKLDFVPHPVELGEFLKGGGSAKCLTLHL